MRVNIEHKETTTGLIFRKGVHSVVLTVSFTEEERAVIHKHRLQDTIIVERRLPNFRLKGMDRETYENLKDTYHLKISNLLKGPDTWTVETPLDAKVYDEEVRAALPRLKSYIEGNATPVKKSETFEL